MKLNDKKKVLLLLSTYLTLLLIPKVKAKSHDMQLNDNYEIGCEDIYATYNNRKIYISNESYIYNIIDNDSDGIYIIDSRNANNPDMKICNSYKIRSKELKNEIIDLLLKYEEDYPSKWDRTKESMYNEWVIHNICYWFSLKKESTKAVDLDNEDEDKYDSKILYKILNNYTNLKKR